MATITKAKYNAPAQVTKFLGLNAGETGDTQIKLGESGNMENFYITNDYKLKKMYGYKSIFTGENTIRCLYGTKIGTVGYLLMATGGKLYYYLQEDLENENSSDDLEPTELGSIADVDCSFFEFNDNVYILCGDYYKFDGTTFSKVSGYVPTIMIGTTPAGSGTEYEDINLLTPLRKQTFTGDGTSTIYYLAEENIKKIESIKINGVVQNPSTYSLSSTEGKVEFTAAPSAGTVNPDNVEIIYEKNNTTDRSIIANMKYGVVFGGDVDTRVFLYGNPSMKNKLYFSYTEDGIPSAEYFTGFGQADVGTSNYSLTDLTRQYDRLLATTNRPDAYYITISTETLDIVLSSGDKVQKYVPSISVYPLNEAHGNLAEHQGQVLNNYPITIDNSGIVMWKATNVRDEKNATIISDRIQTEISRMNKTAFKTIDNQIENQLWLANGNYIYIYNYENDTYSKVIIDEDILGFTSLNNTIYMITSEDKMYKWDKSYIDFDGTAIHSHWEMNFSDFGKFYLRKTMRKLWVQMQPSISSSAEIGYVTNLMTSAIKKKISYEVNGGFDNVDFSNFSFQLSVNPQPFKLKLKAKKFTNMKVTIDNNEKTGCTILAIAMKVESFGESK